MLTKNFTSIGMAGVILLAAGAAHATAYVTTSASSFTTLGGNAGVGSVSDQVNWGLFATALGTSLNNGSISTNDSTATPGNDTVKVTSGDGNGFATYVEGQGQPGVTVGRSTTAGQAWDGLFPAATTILATSDGTITLSFAVPLIGLGLDAQIAAAGAYSETLTAYNAAGTVLTSVTNTGISNGATSGDTSQEGTVPFVGISTDAQNNAASLASNGISYITISADCTTASCVSNGFAIDTSLLYHYPLSNPADPNPTVPEPSTLGLLGVGLAGLGWIRRRRMV